MKPATRKLWIHSAIASVVAVFLSLFGYALNHSGLDEGVFLLVPFCTGLAIAFMSKGRMVVAITAMTSLTTSLLLSLSILLFAGIEGIGCVVMAFPILFVGIGLGAWLGFLIGKRFIHQYGNITILAVCVGLMTLVGWTNKGMEDPESLIVRTSFDFYAPMDRVWSSVTESGTIDGDDSVLRALGLPVPYECTLDDDGNRICYFGEGQMRQKVTKADFGKSFEVNIVESFEVRHWLAFEHAGYDFIQHEDHVEVIRTDKIVSTLRPRWYWSWFEEQCARMEHRFVMASMKQKAESGPRD
jgi:hypothetical protein